MRYLIGYIPSEVDDQRAILSYVLSSDEIDGVEVNFNKEEAIHWLEYNIELAKCLKAKGKIYQIHLPEMTEDALFILDKIGRIIDEVGGPINAVVHHAMGTSIDEDIVLTFEMLDMIYDYLSEHDLDIIIHLENLNIIRSLDNFPKSAHDKWLKIVGRERINVTRIDEILIAYPKLKFCLDFGHMISDKLDFKLTPLQKARVGNIHIHDADDRADHKPSGTCTDIRQMDAFVKSVLNLKNYEGHGVIEVAKVNLGTNLEDTIGILEKEIKLMKGKHYSEIVLTNGEVMKRDKAFEDCSKCGAKKGEFHQSYCEREICPLCDKYISECNHLEGYLVEDIMVDVASTEALSA